MGWLGVLAGAVLIYAGFVNYYSLMVLGGVILLALSMYFIGRRSVVRELVPRLDGLCRAMEEWTRNHGKPEHLTDAVRDFRRAISHTD